MIDLTLKTPFISTDIAPREKLAPGLLEVLKIAVMLRVVMMILAGVVMILVGMRSEHRPPDSIQWVMLVASLEALGLFMFVMWPRARKAAGKLFLPIALGWMMLAPLIQFVIILLATEPIAERGMARAFAPNLGFQLVWFLIPLILAAWQYGRRGWGIAMLVLTAGFLVLGVAIGATDHLAIEGYLLTSVAWLGTIALIGWFIMRMMSALQAEHDALISANRQLSQRAATVEQLAVSRERNRLARELHDTLAHSLTGVSVQLQALATLLKHDPEAAEAQLKETQVTVRTGIQESRRAIEALRATPLEDLGLSEALRQLCDTYAERSGIAINCQIVDVEALDPLTEQTIYRVADAALANSEQHAMADKIGMILTKQPHLRLEIRDNGIGFEPISVAGDRYGLMGMAERAELVCGDLQIISSPGQGTTVILDIDQASTA